MILDQQAQVSISDPIVQFPDWLFGAVPSQGVGPGPVTGREVIILGGSSAQPTSRLTGVVDDAEGPQH
mgnify:FL=1